MTRYKIKIPIISFLLLSILFTGCNGQNSANTANSGYNIEQHPTIIRTQGTQYENVTCQLVDKNGNMWFGTKWFGLSRYDGKTFTTFSKYDH